MSFKPKATVWETAPILRLLLPLVLGIVLYDIRLISQINFVVLSVSLSFLFIIFLGISIVSLFQNRFKSSHFIFSQLFILLIGYSLCYLQDNRHHSLWMGKYPNNTNALLGIVCTEPIEKGKTTKLEIQALEIVGNNEQKNTVGKAIVYVYKSPNAPPVHLGDTVLIPNNWQTIKNSGNPFELDYKRYCARKNIFFQQFISANEIQIYGLKSETSFIQKTHQYCLKSIDEYITESTAKSLLKAMLLGDERDIDPNLRQSYSDTGIIHIISISGAHIAMLFGAVAMLFRKVRKQKYHWIKYALSFFLIWFYVLLAGASTPALRAAIMFSILAIGNLTRQQSNPLNQLLTAAFLMLLFEPMWLFNIGFQLSFIAVLSLIIFYKPVLSLWQPKHSVLRYLAKAIAASIAAEILVAPLVAYYFHSFPPMFLVANVLASISMGLILGLGMLLLIFAQINFIAQFIATFIILFSQAFHYIIDLLHQVNNEFFKTIYISLMGLVLLYFFIYSMSLLLLRKNKNAVWFALTSLLLLSITALHRNWEIQTQNRLIVFNQNKEMQCELLKANTYSVLMGIDSLSYATRNAHIGFGANEKSHFINHAVLEINKNKILIIDSNTSYQTQFPVDVLIVNGAKNHVDINTIISSISPKKIVINNQHEIRNWEKQCAAAHISLHNTSTDGAFVFPY